MLKKAFFLLLLLLLISRSQASAAGYATIKVMAPTKGCIVYIDNMAMEMDKNNVVTAWVLAGSHKISVTLMDDTPIFKKMVNVKEGEINVVNVSYEIKHGHKEAFQEEESAEYVGKEWGTGWGISLGADNTNYQPSITGYSETIDIGMQGDISLFYTGEIKHGTYFDFSTSFLRSSGSFHNAAGSTTFVTANPICIGLKFNIDHIFRIGVGFNYSIWQMSADGPIDVTPGIGYQIYAEVQPIFSEFGYIIKNGYISDAGGVSLNLTSAGVYYKYKIYL